MNVYFDNELAPHMVLNGGDTVLCRCLYPKNMDKVFPGCKVKVLVQTGHLSGYVLHKGATIFLRGLVMEMHGADLKVRLDQILREDRPATSPLTGAIYDFEIVEPVKGSPQVVLEDEVQT